MGCVNASSTGVCRMMRRVAFGFSLVPGVGGFLLHALRGLGYVPSLHCTTVPPDDVLRGLCEVEKVERRGCYLTDGLGVVLSLSSKSVFSSCRPQYQLDRRTFWPVSNTYVER